MILSTPEITTAIHVWGVATRISAVSDRTSQTTPSPIVVYSEITAKLKSDDDSLNEARIETAYKAQKKAEKAAKKAEKKVETPPTSLIAERARSRVGSDGERESRNPVARIAERFGPSAKADADVPRRLAIPMNAELDWDRRRRQHDFDRCHGVSKDFELDFFPHASEFGP